MNSGPSLERIAEYFQRSRFEYLALDYAGKSLRFSRDIPSAEPSGIAAIEPGTAGGASVLQVCAATIGFAEAAGGRGKFPKAGDAVSKNEALFILRRQKSVLTVRAVAGGTLESVLVSEGDFVEFGQPLATLSPTN
jgi:multidrug efflux pump subunit AcrA (membrane-fusion protein)